MSLFEGCQLYISARSPFARRVRLAFLEHKINFEERVEDVFKLPRGFEKINPLLRVPVAILKNGEGVIDSNAILQLFYFEQNQSHLIPKQIEAQILAARWSGMALGLCEMAVQYFLESVRKENKSEEALKEYSDNIKKTVQAFSEFLAGNKFSKEFIAGSLSQSDLDMATALTYLSVRHSQWDWKKHYPDLVDYVETLERREAFLKTKPPR